MGLKKTTGQAEAAYGSFTTAAKLTTIPITANPPAQVTFKHLGTAGFWYIGMHGLVPTTTSYSIKLAPNDAPSEIDPPTGDIYALADGSVNGNLSWYDGWA